MSKQLIVCRGLPASGKSTWAKERVAKGKGTIKRINRDALRDMCDVGVFSESKEKYIRKSEMALAKLFLADGIATIIDDCNLSPSAMGMWQEFARTMNVPHAIQDFTDVSLETCIERDRKRPNYVGEQVIRRMYRDFLQPRPPVLERDPALPDAIIVDIDGTMALMNGRNPYNTAECIHDLLNKPVAAIVLNYAAQGVTILFTSGREETYRTQTIWWLVDHGFGPFNAQCHLFMRPAGDSRKDAVVKREIYERDIQGHFNVLFALDDRSHVVQLWRSLGITCLQVAEGDF